MSDRELLRKIFAIMRNLLLIPYGDCGQIAPRKGTTRRECYRALYEIQELIGSRRLEQPKQTNADRIRAMTDEELAEWLSDALNENSVTGGLCPQTIEFARACYSADCNNKNCIVAWLKKEVDDG